MVWPFRPSSYFKTIRDKRAERDRAINAVPTHKLSSSETLIVSSTAHEIVRHIQEGRWTAVEVVQAFIRSAVRAHIATNAITEVMFDEALQRAAALDKDFAETKEIVGPLHGVPISFKDQYDIAGRDSTIGFTQWANKPYEMDADIVQIVRAAGGIPLFKTNVPQTMLAFESSNPLWGRTTNPYSENHSGGGSSGGEGVVLAMNGSVIGWGSDIGGSLRIPAHYCGVFSLKPSHGRVSYGGVRDPMNGFTGVSSVTGPLARTVQDIELACKLCFGKEGREHFPMPMPYRDVTLPAKLKFGYYTSDGFIKASPACKRAVLETVEALRKQGHECVEFEAPSTHRAMELFAKLSTADGYKTILSHLGPDPMESFVFINTLTGRFSWIRTLTSWIFSKIVGDKFFARIVSVGKETSVAGYYRANQERNEYEAEFYDKVWKRHGFDGIIAPVQAIPAIPHRGSDNLLALANATLLYNIVDSAVGCVPVTRVDPKLDKLTEEWTVRGEGKGQGSPFAEKQLYNGKKPLYDEVHMSGLPVGVQVIGKKWEEEKVIEMMKVVDQAVAHIGVEGFRPDRALPN